MANNKKALIAVALAGLMVSGVAAADDSAAKGKCWGVAKAGQNDCGSKKGTHACKGQAKVDNSMDDFKMGTKAECDAWKGTFEAPVPAKPMSK